MSDSSSTPARLTLIDSLRGIAVIAMMLYHLSWDLSYHGLIDADVVRDPRWAALAHSIAGSFLALAGLSQVISQSAGFDIIRFRRRLLRLALAAGAVSLVTYFVFPDAWIFFGVLHLMLAGSLILQPVLWLPLPLLALLGLGAFLAPAYLTGPFFSHPAFWFLGLTEPTPVSNDYVPVLPWISAMIGGVIAGRLLLRLLKNVPELFVARRPPGRALRGLLWLGRHSLPIYLLHQLILFSAVSGLAMLLPVNPELEQSRFVRACVAECAKSGDEMSCQRFCGCVADGLAPAGFFSVRGGDPDMVSLIPTSASACRPQ